MTTKRSLLTFLWLACASPFASHAAFWAPHIGVDYKFWDYEPSEPYKEIFPQIDHGYNFYVGTRINGYFGFDVGYETSLQKRQSKTFGGGELIFAAPEVTDDIAAVDTRLHALHLDLNFYWEIWRRFEVLFMLGAAHLHFNTHIMHFANNTWVEYQNNSEQKLSGRVGWSTINPIPCLGIKLLVYGDQSQRAEYIGVNENNNPYFVYPYHKSTTVTLGAVYSFGNPRRHSYQPPEDESSISAPPPHKQSVYRDGN